MEIFYFHFPVSGVETNILMPPLFMFLLSMFTSTAGVSGAFVLLPFQMSVLGYTSPGVTATNFIYNIVAIPVGVYKYLRDKKLSMAIFFLLLGGTIPGIFFGYCIRIFFLPNPSVFKVFVAVILSYLGVRLLRSGIKDIMENGQINSPGIDFKIKSEKIGLKETIIELDSGEEVTFSTRAVFIPSLLTGVIGGAYGIGGGALMAPYCVAVLGIPVYLMAGASLLSTWGASVLSVLIYAAGPFTSPDVSTSPDWLLGILFGVGGLGGIWLGAYIQKLIPSWAIKVILGVIVMLISVKYIIPVVLNG